MVSAMTVPSLMQNHQRKTYVVQLHKFYNQLSQALVRFQTDKNAVNLKEAGLLTDFDSFWTSYFNIVNDCGSTSTPCFPEKGSYRMINSSASPYTTQKRFITLADGVSIGYGLSSDFPICLDIDINGSKGPNVVGRDLFIMYIYNNGVIDDYNSTVDGSGAPLTDEQREDGFSQGCYSSSSGAWTGCFGKILNDNWEMTY